MKFIIADKPLTTTHKKHGELSLDKVECPQLESVEEFTTFAGGADSALEFLNSAIETAAKNGGRAALRNIADDANLEEAFAKIRDTIRNYAPTGGGDKAPSTKKKAAAFDSVAELVNSGREFSKEELLALLAAAK